MAENSQLSGGNVPAGTRLLYVYEDQDYDPKNCIICLKSGNTSSTEKGCEQIKRAASIRQDEVSKRIKLGGEFAYHVTNACYKRYTMKKTLARLHALPDEKDVNNDGSIDEDCVSTMSRRSSVGPMAAASTDQYVDADDLSCVVYSHVRVKVNQISVRKKFRLCENISADRFIKTAVYFKDDVFTRVSELMPSDAFVPIEVSRKKVFLTTYIIMLSV